MCAFRPFNQVPYYFFFVFACGVAYGILPLFVVCISPFTFVRVASANGATFKMQLDNFTQQEIDVFFNIGCFFFSFLFFFIYLLYVLSVSFVLSCLYVCWVSFLQNNIFQCN